MTIITTTTMDCETVRTHMLLARRDLLSARDAEAVRAHLAECDACRAADAADAELSKTLGRLPRARASESFKRRLESQWLSSSPSSPPARPSPAPLQPARKQRFVFGKQLSRGAAMAGVAIAIVLVIVFVRSNPLTRADHSSDAMYVEAVNDHLRVLYSEHPVEIENGGIHQVKPWFAGKVDFAPAVAFAGDADFPLKGGSVAYFVDRKAAAFVFSRRLHTITLFVFAGEGLPWPTAMADSAPLGTHRVFAHSARGFHTLLWRDGDLGYAAVSDVSEVELRDFSARVESAK